MSAGTPLSPRSVSITVTWNVAVTVLGVSSPSVVWHVTVVVPTGNSEPEPWSQVTEGAVASSSTAVGGKKPTAAPPAVVAWTVTFAGMPLRARSLSPTITRNVAVTAVGVSSPSAAPHVTVVVPIGNVEPEAGVQLTAGVLASSSTAEGAV